MKHNPHYWWVTVDGELFVGRSRRPFLMSRERARSRRRRLLRRWPTREIVIWSGERITP